MKNPLIVISLLVVFAFLPSCATREGRVRMDAVDSLINDKPDSALKILLNMPANLHLRGENEARYNMLLTEAAYKVDGITIPDSVNPLLTDSIIGKSVSYYELHGEPSDKARARYLAGIVDYELGMYDKALVHFLRADKFETGENNPKLKGLINRGIGWCFSEYYDITSAVEYHKKSCEWFKNANEPLYAVYEMATIAYKYRSLENDSLMNEYCQYVENYAIKNSNQNLLTCSLLTQGDMLVNKGKYKEAVKIYDRLPDLNNPEITEDNFMRMGTAYLIEGNLDKAMEFNKKVTSLEPAMNGIILNKMAREKKYKALSDTLMHSLAILDSVRNSVWTRNSLATINEYYKSEDDKNAAIADSLRSQNWIIAISVLLLLTVVMTIYFLRTSYLKKTLYKTLSEADNLRLLVNKKEDYLISAERQLHEKNENIEHLNRDVHSLCADISGLNQDLDSLKFDNSKLKGSNSDLENRL